MVALDKSLHIFFSFSGTYTVVVLIPPVTDTRIDGIKQSWMPQEEKKHPENFELY